jgi:hypothetical protein
LGVAHSRSLSLFDNCVQMSGKEEDVQWQVINIKGIRSAQQQQQNRRCERGEGNVKGRNCEVWLERAPLHRRASVPQTDCGAAVVHHRQSAQRFE